MNKLIKYFLIVIVLLVIAFVTYQYFFSEEDQQNRNNPKSPQIESNKDNTTDQQNKNKQEVEKSKVSWSGKYIPNEDELRYAFNKRIESDLVYNKNLHSLEDEVFNTTYKSTYFILDENNTFTFYYLGDLLKGKIERIDNHTIKLIPNDKPDKYKTISIEYSRQFVFENSDGNEITFVKAPE